MPLSVHVRRAVCPLLVWSCSVLTLFAGQLPAHTYRQKERAFYTADQFARTTAGKVRIQRGIDAALESAVRRAYVPLPVTRFTVVSGTPSATWIGTREGAIRLSANYQEREYFSGQRWLPDDHVTGIGLDGDIAWLETPAGYSRISYVPMTLPEKSKAFVERVQTRHNRWGLTANSQLQVAGDLSTNHMVPDDNDGLWTAMYVAAECFRYKVTGAVDARANAKRGMDAIVRLEAITGIPGFPARSFLKTGEEAQPSDGEWHDSPERGWRWKGNTSSDEIVGHFFVYPIYYDLVAEDVEKPALRAAIDRIMSHILDNDYRLLGFEGKPTRWGWWAPAAIWADPDETGLRALHMLAHLRVAEHITADAAKRARYQAAYEDLVRTHKYHLLTRNQKVMVPGHVNHSDDELAFLSFYPLLRYETNPALLDVYRQSLERSWQIERPERNPLWNLIYAAGTGAAEFDRAATVRTLQEIPMDQIQWSVRNSNRVDVPLDPLADRFQHAQALTVLRYDELPMWKWNGNPYLLDGGHAGRSEDDGAFFLLPYWMGRFHQLLVE